MGAFADLEINPAVMREAVSSAFPNTEFTDNELIALKQTIAKVSLKNDMRLDLKIIDEDSSLFDTYVENYPESFQSTLMWKQLYYYFNDFREGEGSKNDVLADNYNIEYESARMSWPKNTITENIVRKSSVIIRG